METKHMTEYLSEDCITEILCRLPIKALVGFKCVCKLWNTLLFPMFAFPEFRGHPPSHLAFCSVLETLLIEMNTLWTLSRILMVTVITLLAMGLLSHFLDCCHPKRSIWCARLLQWVDSTYQPNCSVLLCVQPSDQTVYWDSTQNKARKRVCHSSLAFDPQESTHFKVICFK